MQKLRRPRFGQRRMQRICEVNSVLDECAVLVSEAAAKDNDKVNKSADSEPAGGEEPEDTCADLAYVETMDTETAEEEAEKSCNNLGFYRDLIRHD